MAAQDVPHHAEVLGWSAAELTGALSVDGDVLERTSGALVRAACSVPHVDHVGFALAVRGAFVARSTGDAVVDDLDRVQAGTGVGPGPEVAAGRGACDVPDLAAVPRFARLAEVADRHGLRGVLALPLTAHDGVLGVLTLWTRSAVDARGRELAEAVAAQATVALFGAQRIAGLARAVVSRDVIGQAKGILMQRDGVDDEAAFGLLVEASQTTNIKLVDVAHWLVSQAATATGAATPVVGPGKDGAPTGPGRQGRGRSRR
jgi:GAF domain-containing protein